MSNQKSNFTNEEKRIKKEILLNTIQEYEAKLIQKEKKLKFFLNKIQIHLKHIDNYIERINHVI